MPQKKKIDRVGEVYYNNQGLKMTIIKYNGSDDVTVEFEDGYIKNTRYAVVKSGHVKNDNCKDRRARKDRVGETGYNNKNELMKIIEYNTYRDIVVEFQDEYKSCIHTSYQKFKDGSVSNPYSNTKRGEYKIGECGRGNKKNKMSYWYWNAMISRCHDNYFLEKEPSYKQCTICEEWREYSSFDKWFDENYYEIENEKMELDKDILFKGNKIYSPETCIFVPKNINLLFVKSDAKRGDYPIGVNYNKRSGKFIARCGEYGKRVHLGTFTTPEEAFNVYKNEKERYIKEVADLYKDRIPQNLYEALYKYEVEITD